MSKPEMLKKISPKTVMGEKITAPLEAGHLFRVVGVCSGLKTGQSNFGEWVAFTGEFNVERNDGKRFYGTKLFLPDPVQTLLVTAVKGLADKSSLVEVALDVGIKPSDAPIGYEYTCSPLVEVAASTPLQALMERIGATPVGQTPALPAPKDERAKGKKKKGR